MERCWPDEGWDTTGLCPVLFHEAGAGPCAGHAGTKMGALRGIGVCPAKVIFDPETGLVSIWNTVPLLLKCLFSKIHPKNVCNMHYLILLLKVFSMWFVWALSSNIVIYFHLTKVWSIGRGMCAHAHGPPSCNVYCSLHTSNCTLHTTSITLHTAHYTLQTAHVHCRLHTVLQTADCRLQTALHNAHCWIPSAHHPLHVRLCCHCCAPHRQPWALCPCYSRVFSVLLFLL